MNIKFIFVYLILILNFIFKSESLQYNDITPNKINRYYTSDTQCSYSYYILCLAGVTDRCGTSISISPSSGTTFSFLGSNDTAAVFKVNINVESSPSIQVFTIFNMLQISIECYDLDINNIDFKLVYDYFLLPQPYTTILGILELSGIEINDNTAIPLNVAFEEDLLSSCSLEHYYRNYFLLTCYSLPISYDLSPVSFEINSRTFQIQSFIKDYNYDNITDIKLYPDVLNNNNFILFGFNEGLVLEFTSNITNSNIYPYIYSLNGDSSSMLIRPIKSDGETVTYLYTLNKYDQDYDFQLYSQVGSSFDSRYSFSVNVPQFSFQTPQVPSLPITVIYFNNLPIINIGYQHNFVYISTPINYDFGEHYSISKAFPYGFIDGNNYKYTINSTTIISKYNYLSSNNYFSIYSNIDNSGSYDIFYSSFILNFVYQDVNLPMVYNYTATHIVSDLYLYEIDVKTPYGFLFIQTSFNIYGQESRIYGNSLHGIYQVVGISNDPALSVYDIYGRSFKLLGSLLTTPLQFATAPDDFNFDIYSIQNVSYLYNNLDVTNHRQYNVLYFNYSQDVPRDTQFRMIPLTLDMNQNPFSSSEFQPFHSTWNSDLELFEIEFYIDGNTRIGTFNYQLSTLTKSIYSIAFSKQLIIEKSNLDLQGPIFNNITKFTTSKLNNTNSNGEFGWLITIKDSVNGFKNGYIIVRGSMDSSIYNFTITPSNLKDGDIFLGQYEIKLNLSYPCISQDYIITDTVLYDQFDRISLFSIYNSNSIHSSMLNPFLNYLQDSNINKITLECQTFTNIIEDFTSPVLDSFIVSSSQVVDVGKTNRQISIEFKASDLESGIRIDQYPIVYISTFNDMLECKSKVLYHLLNSTYSPYGNTVAYSCTIQLPLGFGYGQDIILSVYGFINNNGYYSGYSTSQLLELGYKYLIETTTSLYQPNINSYYRITESGGDLWLFGSTLWVQDSTTTAYITFNDDNSTTSINSTISFSTVIKIPNIKSTYQSFDIYIISNGLTSNTITVTPTIFDYYINKIINSSSSESSSDMLPTLSPLPTNSPKSCSGNPICGGPSNGKCIENQGCVCYSPWIGLDCLSQIIIIDQPTTNDTSPSTNITLPVNNNNSLTTVTYKSLITLVSIRELNVLGSVVYNKSFDKWQFKELDSTTFIYNTTLEIKKNNQISTTEFTVTLKWFTNETTINFANEQLLMNPSTMKYTIEISNYPFDNNLNQLQLIMSASLQSNSSDNICSLREYGETTSGDNSNYLKIQVDNHSLFGRFIRRGIIDSTITSITNLLLDKDMNSITTTKELQSYIAIQIPNYKRSVIVDPDFSIILDSYSASSKSNSICSNKSKLTNGKIAGIVIGCAAFLVVIIIAVSYHIIKKKNKQKFMENVNQKMKQMNNEKL